MLKKILIFAPEFLTSFAMTINFAKLISPKVSVAEKQVQAVLDLLESGCTIPFISRYRKEATGGLDEVQIGNISTHYDKLCEIQKRKLTIISSIEEQGKLTDELRQRIETTWDATELEDIYLPYRPKRRTRASIAREKGYEPLATSMLELCSGRCRNAKEAIADLKVATEEAIAGAKDIIAETMSEDERARGTVRRNFQHDAVLHSKRKKTAKAKAEDQEAEDAAQKYRDYFDWEEPLKRCQSHRLLAMRRGQDEGFLSLSITGDEALCIERLTNIYVKDDKSPATEYVVDAITDGFKRLLAPSIETEFMQAAKEKADTESIKTFTHNLEQLLMSAPLGQKRVLALDPGFRTGCKLVILDREGNLMMHDVIYPHPPKSQFIAAMDKVTSLAEKYDIEAVSIGNGTASRETEEFVKGLGLHVPVYVVSEDGASIYSASKVAREEFPDEDVTVRGAVSIGRRLMDPLAELVKIDPNSIGVGQYQKDVDQKALKDSLDMIVERCVNKVGVNVNTASKHLLTYVSGLGPSLAQNIVDYRAKNGAFKNRKAIAKVPRMGAKAFEQAAGFLRIEGGDNPLDNSAVHPESYHVVEDIAKSLGCKVAELIGEKGAELRARVNINDYASAGIETVKDILKELEKPGRDPRGELEEFAFSKEVKVLEDVVEGMVLPGIVTNITNFGAFVDVGVHTQGLVHVSEMSDHFVKDPTTIVSLHQHVMVKVKEVDLKRKRLSLTMKDI